MAGPGISSGESDLPFSLADFYGAVAQHMGWPQPSDLPEAAGFFDPPGLPRALPLRGCLFVDHPTTGVVQYPEKLLVEQNQASAWRLSPGFGEVLGSTNPALQELLPSPPSCAPTDPDLEARLAALGYIVADPQKGEDPSEAHQRDDYTEE